jgi:hypothetical protein
MEGSARREPRRDLQGFARAPRLMTAPPLRLFTPRIYHFCDRDNRSSQGVS